MRWIKRSGSLQPGASRAGWRTRLRAKGNGFNSSRPDHLFVPLRKATLCRTGKHPLFVFVLLGSFFVPFLLAIVVTSAEAEEQTQAQAVDCKSVSGPGVVLSDAQCQTLQYFFATFVGEPITKIERVVGSDQALYRHDIRLMVNRQTVDMNPSSPTICRFFGRSHRNETAPTPRAASKEEAFACALPVLKYCNEPTNMAEYTFTLTRGKDEWIIAHPFTYGGLPYIGPRLSVHISTVSGRLLAFGHRPPTQPKAEPKCIISARTAVEAAIKWKKSVEDPCNMYSPNFARSRAQFPFFASWHAKEVLAWANDRGDLDLTKVAWNEPHYCWMVPFYWYEDAFEGSNRFNGDVLVDMETGQIVGRL